MSEESVINREYFYDIVNEIASENKIKDVKVVFKNGVESGINFIGIIHRFTLEGNRQGEKVQLHMIGKVITQNEDKREIMSLDTFAKREFFAYVEIFRNLDTVAKETGCKMRIQRPLCYRAGAEKLKEIIILEDLSTKGYEQCRLGKSLDLNHAVLLLNQMACLHAQMFVYKDKYPKQFAKMSEGLTDILFTKVKYIEKTVEFALNYAREHACCKDADEIFDAFEKHDVIQKNRFLLDGSNEKYAIICHGDLWANNLMFRYENQQPVGVMLLDWQCIRYSSPVTDLLFAIFISFNVQTRKERFPELLDMYYEALAAQIKALNGDPEILYPEKIYREHLMKYSYAGFSSALIMLTIFNGAGEVPPDDKIKESFEKQGTVFTGEKVSEEYKAQMQRTIQDIKENGLHRMW